MAAALYQHQAISEIEKLTFSDLKFWYMCSPANPRNQPKKPAK